MTNEQPIDVRQLANEARVSPEALKSNYCSDKDLRYFAANLCDEKWELIAYELKLTTPQISAIKDDNKGAELQRVKFLMQWKEKELNPSYEMLAEAFLKCGKTQQALEICKRAKISFESSVSRTEEQPQKYVTSARLCRQRW